MRDCLDEKKNRCAWNLSELVIFSSISVTYGAIIFIIPSPRHPRVIIVPETMLFPRAFIFARQTSVESRVKEA